MDLADQAGGDSEASLAGCVSQVGFTTGSILGFSEVNSTTLHSLKDRSFSADTRNDRAIGHRPVGLPRTVYEPVIRMESRPDSFLQYELTCLYSANMDISANMNYVMELLAFQQSQLTLIQQSLLHPPPPPPPPRTCYESASVQTELLSGEIDGMGDRLMLYRSRIKTLEECAQHYHLEVGRLTTILDDLRAVGARESTRAERSVSDLRRENNRLKEYSDLKDSKLMECNKLIEYYKEELKNVSSL